MIRSVVIRPENGTELTLELARPDKTGIAVTNIDGLAPPKIDVNMFGLVTTDGSYFGSSRVPQRNLVFDFRLIPNADAQESRLRLYRAFPIHRNVTMEILTDARHVSIDGRVEAIEADIFTDAASVQVSLLCPNPYFKGIGNLLDNTVGLYGEIPLLEFPFEDLNDSTPSMVLSTIESYGPRVVTNRGDVPCGFRLEIAPSWGTGDITFVNLTTGESLVLLEERLEELAAPHSYYDTSRIVISTENGEKYARLYLYGQAINILGALAPGSDWVKLIPGVNQVSIVPENTTESYFNAKISLSSWYSGV